MFTARANTAAASMPSRFEASNRLDHARIIPDHTARSVLIPGHHHRSIRWKRCRLFGEQYSASKCFFVEETSFHLFPLSAKRSRTAYPIRENSPIRWCAQKNLCLAIYCPTRSVRRREFSERSIASIAFSGGHYLARARTMAVGCLLHRFEHRWGRSSNM